MALDEALLENASSVGRSILRFYGWTEPAATFGYFQKYADIERWTRLRPLIRRPTGGGLVPHDADWTYSLIVPPAEPWYELSATESYRLIRRIKQPDLKYIDDGQQVMAGSGQFVVNRVRKLWRATAL